jgi:hypothetical protein
VVAYRVQAHPQGVGDLLVRQLLAHAEEQALPLLGGQLVDGGGQGAHALGVDHLREGARGARVGHVLGEGHPVRAPASFLSSLLPGGAAHVARDGEQPGQELGLVREAGETLPHPGQHRLDQVFGVLVRRGIAAEIGAEAGAEGGLESAKGIRHVAGTGPAYGFRQGFTAQTSYPVAPWRWRDTQREGRPTAFRHIGILEYITLTRPLPNGVPMRAVPVDDRVAAARRPERRPQPVEGTVAMPFETVREAAEGWASGKAWGRRP